MVGSFVLPWTAEAHSVLTKLQIIFCVLAGLGIVVFGVGMISNVNVAKVPGWLAPVAWGSFGLIAASCVGVVVTLALDREKEPDLDEDEAELLPIDEPGSEEPGSDEPRAEEDEVAPGLTTVADTETIAETDIETVESEPAEVAPEPAQIEFAEPGNDETIEFSNLPLDE
jgi:hypothetical protein